jgi:hypothetical protein
LNKQNTSACVFSECGLLALVIPSKQAHEIQTDSSKNRGSPCAELSRRALFSMGIRDRSNARETSGRENELAPCRSALTQAKRATCVYPQCDGGSATGYCHNDCRVQMNNQQPHPWADPDQASTADATRSLIGVRIGTGGTVCSGGSNAALRISGASRSAASASSAEPLWLQPSRTTSSITRATP